MMLCTLVLRRLVLLLSFSEHASEVYAVEDSEDNRSHHTDDYNCDDGPCQLLFSALAVGVAHAFPAAA